MNRSNKGLSLPTNALDVIPFLDTVLKDLSWHEWRKMREITLTSLSNITCTIAAC